MESLEKRENGLVCVDLVDSHHCELRAVVRRWTRASAEREAACPWGVRLRIGTAQAQGIIYLRENWGTLSPLAGVRSLARRVIIGKNTLGI